MTLRTYQEMILRVQILHCQGLTCILLSLEAPSGRMGLCGKGQAPLTLWPIPCGGMVCMPLVPALSLPLFLWSAGPTDSNPLFPYSFSRPDLTQFSLSPTTMAISPSYLLSLCSFCEITVTSSGYMYYFCEVILDFNPTSFQQCCAVFEFTTVIKGAAGSQYESTVCGLKHTVVRNLSHLLLASTKAKKS